MRKIEDKKIRSIKFSTRKILIDFCQCETFDRKKRFQFGKIFFEIEYLRKNICKYIQVFIAKKL